MKVEIRCPFNMCFFTIEKKLEIDEEESDSTMASSLSIDDCNEDFKFSLLCGDPDIILGVFRGSYL